MRNRHGTATFCLILTCLGSSGTCSIIPRMTPTWPEIRIIASSDLNPEVNAPGRGGDGGGVEEVENAACRQINMIADQINFVMAVASFAPGAVPTIGSLYFRCLYLKLSPACSGTGTQRHKVDVLTYETHKYYL